MKATWFVTDDAAARYYAENVELEVHGSLGIVLYNAALGYISKSGACSALHAVRMGSLYISDYVYDRAVQMLKGITNN